MAATARTSWIGVMRNVWPKEAEISDAVDAPDRSALEKKRPFASPGRSTPVCSRKPKELM